MKLQAFKKPLALLSILSLLLNQLLFVPQVFAQESTPSAIIESTSSAQPSANPEVTPIPAPAPTPSPISEWQDVVDKATTTKDNVVTDHLYEAPQNSKVTVKFNKLPENKGKLTIKEVTLTDEQVTQTKALSNIAYDITSDMQNGTFEYTLTLPAPKTDNVEVKASEDGQSFVTLGGVTAQSDTLTITGLNHFTLFVAVSADTSSGGSFASLNNPNPTLTEPSVGQIATGTLVLNIPLGFSFNTSSNVTATVTNVSCNGQGNNKLKLGNGGGQSSQTVPPTATTITFTVAESSSGISTCAGTITFAGIQVKANSGTPLTSGQITITGTTGTADFGPGGVTLTEVAGAVSPTNSALLASPSSVPADGISTSTITVTLKDAFNNLVTNTSVSLSLVSGSATTSGSPATTNSSGQATFTVKSSTIGSAVFQANSGAVTINQTATVNFTNAAPSFDAISPQNVDEDAGSRNIPITNVLPGPESEASQTVNFSATSNNTSLIPNPSVSGVGANRTLTYTPVDNANGTATITVTANDGQAQNNTSSKTFNITVNAVNDPPTVTITSPNGGQTWAGGSSQDITWNASDVDIGDSLKVKLEYTTDGGSSYNAIADNLANSGTYSWTVPAIDSTTVKIRTTVADVALVQGIDSSDANFTIASASISGMKYEDKTGTPGLLGWTINLSGDSSLTTTTDINGNYNFATLLPGLYQICEVLQSGWTQTAPTSGYDCGNSVLGYEITLSAGENLTGQNFGNFNYGQVSGKKYEDVNENGEDDEGELWLEGWTIYIDADNNGQLDDGELYTNTNFSGSYTFSNLGPGTYTIREVQQDGWKQTDPTSDDSSIGGQSDKSYVITMTSNGNKTQRNFGNFHLGTISGQKFNDINGDGARNGEDFGLEDWIIFLDANDNGELDEGETSTTTDMDGYYEFSGLATGTYKVREVLQPGWMQTTDNPSDVAVISGTSVSNIDFGNFQKITITGRKFEDKDANASYDDSLDSVLSGWNIFIDTNNNDALDDGERVTTTAEDGSYSFDNLGSGTYKIREAQQNGWVQTTSNPDDIVVQSGNAVSGIDFGNFKKVIITGYKWKDLDADGVLDEGELGIGGWNMSLSKVTTNTTSTTNPDGGEPIMTEIVSLSLVSTLPTDSNGQVNLEVDKPGTYRLTEESQDNFQRTYPTDSFFDVFVDLGGQTITTDKNNHPLRFGNAPFQKLSDAKFVPSGDATSSASLVVLGDSTISVSVNGGTSSVFLPNNTIITNSTDGGTIDVTKLSAQTPSSLTGFDSNTVVDGSLQWGIPDLGLKFSQAITLNIFVGTSLNGQTLKVIRSTTGTSGWTSDGIEDPKTCTVASGICTFKATRASYYATTHTTAAATTTSSSSSSSSGSDGGDGRSDGLGCATHDCSVRSASLVAQVSGTSTQATGFTPGVLGIQSNEQTNANVGVGEVEGISTPSAVQQEPAATAEPQVQATTGTPFNVKVAVIVVAFILAGFGLFKLLVK